MRFLIQLLMIITIIGCHSQKKNLMSIPKLNKNIEKLSDVFLSPNDTVIAKKTDEGNESEKLFVNYSRSYYGGKNYEVNDQNQNRIAYLNELSDGSYSGLDYTQNPVMGISREFYPNGSIKSKGIICWFGFNLGFWYYFDEDGKIIKTINHDEGFNFTYEQIFRFCEERNIPLDKKYSGFRTKIWKQIISNSVKYWHIEFPIIENFNDQDFKISKEDLESGKYIRLNEVECIKRVNRHIKLDGNSGEILEDEENPLPLDNENKD